MKNKAELAIITLQSQVLSRHATESEATEVASKLQKQYGGKAYAATGHRRNEAYPNRYSASLAFKSKKVDGQYVALVTPSGAVGAGIELPFPQ